MRFKLREMMILRCPEREWLSITEQKGMFWFSGQLLYFSYRAPFDLFLILGLTRAQGQKLVSRHVYMLPSNGRMSLCGLNDSNLSYFADTLCQVLDEPQCYEKSVTKLLIEMENDSHQL